MQLWSFTRVILSTSQSPAIALSRFNVTCRLLSKTSIHLSRIPQHGIVHIVVGRPEIYHGHVQTPFPFLFRILRFVAWTITVAVLLQRGYRAPPSDTSFVLVQLHESAPTARTRSTLLHPDEPFDYAFPVECVGATAIARRHDGVTLLVIAQAYRTLIGYPVKVLRRRCGQYGRCEFNRLRY